MSKIEATDSIKPKRGRRSKKEILASQELAKLNALNAEDATNSIIGKNNIHLQISSELKDDLGITDAPNIFLQGTQEDENIIVKPPAKKRGRKPKGGKIIQQTMPIVEQKENKPNIILHLKCSLKDLQVSGDYNSNFTNSNIDSFQFSNASDLAYEIIDNPNETNLNFSSVNSSVNSSKNNATNATNATNTTNTTNTINTTTNNTIHCNSTISSNLTIGSTIINNDMANISYNNIHDDDACETKEIWRKLKTLEHNLHINNVSDKKSACFWCSYDFDNPPIYIPKHFIKDSYHVYGCFCSPECGVAHLMEENIDSSTKFERYYLMNHIYSKIYQYSKNIKPAPNPHYMLDKYYGNLSIQEYRTLLKSERLFLIVDKPLTRILPEFHEDNDDFIINNKIIPSNNFQLKKRLQKKQQTKNNILNEHFGVSST